MKSLKSYNKIKLANNNNQNKYAENLAIESFKVASPFWPLKNLIAVNPLQGLEELPIEEALLIGASYFEQEVLPAEMENVNRETIKWLQVLFDTGQASIPLPIKNTELYETWHNLAIYDRKLHKNDKKVKAWLENLPNDSEQVISTCLAQLGIEKQDHLKFSTLMLTTLPGWASHVKYLSEWSGTDSVYPFGRANQVDYLAIRMVISTLIWPESKKLLTWHKNILKNPIDISQGFEKIKKLEESHHLPLLGKLAAQKLSLPRTYKAQLVFCIDTRSEPFRRALESTDDYQTFGFAGFFGIPLKITDSITEQSYQSCPVLLSPKHEISESRCSEKKCNHALKTHKRLSALKKIYQSQKYNFTTPFGLAESSGFTSGMLMALCTFAPKTFISLKEKLTGAVKKSSDITVSLKEISVSEQTAYAHNALTLMGLVDYFAPLVVFCGHGSATQNNPYATALDCGACGGRHGGSNALVLSTILNNLDVRKELKLAGINIPDSTQFLAAQHNTTTDEVIIFGDKNSPAIHNLKQDLEKARSKNTALRIKQIQNDIPESKSQLKTALRSQDWAEVRPEWGLARNSAFIVAPRGITESLDLGGRCFLHSYDYTKDPNGASLTTILTAPMVVAQWINAQYFFSTINNVAYGSGSKITQNIAGKIGVMQGNASDLMTGLSLQSLYKNDTERYHQPLRLMTIVYAPREIINSVLQTQQTLKKLFGNGWVKLACIDPITNKSYIMNRNLSWQNFH